MERIDRILNHPKFRVVLQELDELERDRIFCRHGLNHLLDVARLMRIMNGEEGLGISKSHIYAAALLHDIGRAEQYKTGNPHALAGLPLAEEILSDCGFCPEEREELVTAIAHHGKGYHPSPMAQLLYRADKRSRACFACPGADACKWTAEEKNLTLEY